MDVDFRDNVLVRNTNLRRLFFGRLVTNAGDSVYAIAAMWLVYDLTGSSAYTGLAGLLTMGPQALQVFVGPLVDRWPLRRILVGTQVLQAVLVLVIPLAHFLDLLSVWVVLTVMPLVSLLNQFVYPAQSAALPRIVEQADLVSANSLLSLAYQGVDMAFNALAGVLVATVGAVTLYLIDSVTFVVAATLFLGLRVSTTCDAEGDTDTSGQSVTAATDGGVDDRSSYLAELRAGLSFMQGTILFPLLATSVVANGLLGGVWAAMPAFADARGGPEAYGLLMAAIAGGMLVGALAGGAVADRSSATSVVAAGGVGLLFVAVYVAAIPSLRRLPRTGDLQTLDLA